MSNRWTILALLFALRAVMAIQFQSAAALSPFLMARFGIGLADIGLLIGLYLSPGIVFAMPGAAIGQRFGDKWTVALGMVLMLVGGLAMLLLPFWTVQIAGRILAGTGGVIVNVLMTKMVADRFHGPDLAPAMGIFVNSWPVGIAGALMVLPAVAERFGLEAAQGAVASLAAVGLLLLAILYRPVAERPATGITEPPRLRGPVLICVLIAAAIWGLYNAGLGVIFGFGPVMLVERGWSASAASSTASLALWLVALSVPLGGLVVARLGRERVLVTSLAAFAILMLVAPATPNRVAMFVALGAVGGLAAGPIMSLPGDVLSPGNRAYGMGVFHTFYYVTVFAAPAVAGHFSEAAGTSDVAFTFGSGMLLACLPLLGLFRALARRTTGAMIAA
jgi:MFS family permease